MKKILMALIICAAFAGAGYCAPYHHDSHGVHHKHAIKNPPPPKPAFVSVRRHKHHVPVYTYDYYPSGTQVIINTGGLSVGYGIGYGGGYVTYGGGFRI